MDNLWHLPQEIALTGSALSFRKISFERMINEIQMLKLNTIKVINVRMGDELSLQWSCIHITYFCLYF